MVREKRITRLLLRAMVKFAIRIFFLIRKTLIYKNDIDFVQPCVVANFHNEMIPMVRLMRNRNFVILASKNHVGYPAGELMISWGYKTVYGSPSKGGKSALKLLRKELNEGNSVVITTDGSRGPRHKMKAGAVILANDANVPLYLVSPRYRGVKLKFLWDHLLYPLPFSKVTYKYIKMNIGPDLNKEELGKKLLEAESLLKSITNDAVIPPCENN